MMHEFGMLPRMTVLVHIIIALEMCIASFQGARKVDVAPDCAWWGHVANQLSPRWNHTLEADPALEWRWPMSQRHK